jgi:hypothetical protein
MARLTALVIDTYQEREILKIALNMTSQCEVVKDVVLLSDNPIPGYSFSPIEKVHSTKTYNQLMLNIIPEKFLDEHLMIFQWDGFALNSNNWNDDFLKYDFIGAPHYSQIYNKLLFNGGFSLRSPSLNQLMKENPFFSDNNKLSNEPEDVIINNLLGEYSKENKFKLPSYELARRFSFEHGEINSPFFGFHGVFNFPHLFSEDTLLTFINEFKERLNQPHILLHFIQVCIEKKYFEFLKILLEKRPSWPALELCVSEIQKNANLWPLRNSLQPLLIEGQFKNTNQYSLISLEEILGTTIYPEIKLEIYDSGIKVAKISVTILVRNNELYLPKLFKMLSNLENTYDCSFEYIFLENSSLDNSVNLIRDFINSRAGSITSIGDTKKIDEMPRTVKMAFLRNYAKAIHINSSDWSLLIDTDVYFHSNILIDLFSQSPSKNNIGMLCAFGEEITPSDHSAPKWISQGHYYDTFAFTSKEKGFFWPHCNFLSCTKCTNITSQKIERKGLIDVNSAFGGFVLINSSLYYQQDIRWDAHMINDTWLCEHIGFCFAILEKTKSKIAIAPNATVYWDCSTFSL